MFVLCLMLVIFYAITVSVSYWCVDGVVLTIVKVKFQHNRLARF